MHGLPAQTRQASSHPLCFSAAHQGWPLWSLFRRCALAHPLPCPLLPPNPRAFRSGVLACSPSPTRLTQPSVRARPPPRPHAHTLAHAIPLLLTCCSHAHGHAGTATSLLSSAAVSIRQRSNPEWQPSVAVPSVGHSSGGLGAYFAANVNTRCALTAPAFGPVGGRASECSSSSAQCVFGQLAQVHTSLAIGSVVGIVRFASLPMRCLAKVQVP